MTALYQSFSRDYHRKYTNNWPLNHGLNDWEITHLFLAPALQTEVEILEPNPTFNKEASPPLSTMNFASAARVQYRPPSESPRDSQPRPCFFCDHQHHPQQCTVVTDAERRWDIVRSKRRCFNCLGWHQVSDYMTRARCRTCHRKHHTSLCHLQQTVTLQGLQFLCRLTLAPVATTASSLSSDGTACLNVNGGCQSSDVCAKPASLSRGRRTGHPPNGHNHSLRC